MALNPLNELKRRLEDESTALPKRLCLAKNVVHTHHFPAGPKERVVGDWLYCIVKDKKVTSSGMRNVLSWTTLVDDLTGEFKSKMIEMVAHYVQHNALREGDVASVLAFMQNDKINEHLSNHVSEFLVISKTLLKHLLSDVTNSHSASSCVRILENYVKHYRVSKRKMEFIGKFVEGENLETIFDCLDNGDLRSVALRVCRDALFPMTKKSFYSIFLQTLIRKNNMEELMQEKGDNIQSVVKVMSVFFMFPSGRTKKEPAFLQKFIDTFVSCYNTESQLVFAFYILIVCSLNMEQDYLLPIGEISAIEFEGSDEKVKRKLFLSMLTSLLDHNVDINVRLTDTFGEKLSKAETKKNFSSFLQRVMTNQLKLERKTDKTTLEIITIALKLDPILIEENLDKVLPPLMVSKKNSSVADQYTGMLNCLLDTLFKLSRGTVFFNHILPHLKLLLEERNTEQFELKINASQCLEGVDRDKLISKIVHAEDIFPHKCVERYGRLTVDLMFRQNGELLLSLQKDFEVHCLMMFEEGFVSPSVILIAEIMAAILSSFFKNCKMADHTVPEQIAEEFWSVFVKFETDVLKKFGECLLKLSPDPQITSAFLKLLLGFAQLKILNTRYSNFKTGLVSNGNIEDVFNLSLVLPCFNSEQWNEIQRRAEDSKSSEIFNNLLILKMVLYDLSKSFDDSDKDTMSATRDYLIKKLTDSTVVHGDSYMSKVLFKKLNMQQVKRVTKQMLKVLMENPDLTLFDDESVKNNRQIATGLTVEILKDLLKVLDEPDSKPCLGDAIAKTDFDIGLFCSEIDVKEYFERLSQPKEFDEKQSTVIANSLGLLKQLQIYNLNENITMATILILFAIKKATDRKKLRKNVDAMLQIIFEMSSRKPDLFKLFPVDYMFSFPDNTFFDLAMLRFKTNNRLLIIRTVLETAVKKVKTDNTVIKELVKILIKNQKNKEHSSIEFFGNVVFQLSCVVLPLIAKEKKAITTSAYRSVLAELQEKLHKSMLKTFKSMDFNKENSLFLQAGNPEDSVLAEGTIATLNAMEAYALTLSRYCETNDSEEIKNLDCLWSGLEYFVQNAIASIKDSESKIQHVETSVQLINSVLRYSRKLESHIIFQNKDDTLLQIWRSLRERLVISFSQNRKGDAGVLEDIGITLKFISELSTLECFVGNFVGDLCGSIVLKKPSSILNEREGKTLASHRAAKYMWTCVLRSNVVGPKCVALSKAAYASCRAVTSWLRQHYDVAYPHAMEESEIDMEDSKTAVFANKDRVANVKMDDKICDLLVTDLGLVSEFVLATKRISLNYKFMDAIFECQHMVHKIMSDVSWQAYFGLYASYVALLNNMLLSREELLEDRWPCYLQCYRSVVDGVCVRAKLEESLPSGVEERLTEAAYSIEKLTQAMCKRKAHMSRLSIYLVADLCSCVERHSPPRALRQHLATAAALLLQAAEGAPAAAFLGRALAGAPGRATAADLHDTYKRYHQYRGNW